MYIIMNGPMQSPANWKWSEESHQRFSPIQVLLQLVDRHQSAMRHTATSSEIHPKGQGSIIVVVIVAVPHGRNMKSTRTNITIGGSGEEDGDRIFGRRMTTQHL